LDTSVVAITLAALMLGLCYVMGKQFARPRGWLGRRLMVQTLNQGNKSMLARAVESLKPRPEERIVDVGFGGGYALDRIRERVAPARPVGIEISVPMIEAGRERWREAVELHRADVTAMPLADAAADGILSVNTIYFWPDPGAALKEIRRVLKPGGRLVLGIRRQSVMRLSPITWFGFRLYSVRAIEDLLRRAGFDVAVEEKVKGELIVVARPT
jgi:SAM-dependent methyltransferase